MDSVLKTIDTLSREIKNRAIFLESARSELETFFSTGWHVHGGRLNGSVLQIDIPADEFRLELAGEFYHIHRPEKRLAWLRNGKRDSGLQPENHQEAKGDVINVVKCESCGEFRVKG